MRECTRRVRHSLALGLAGGALALGCSVGGVAAAVPSDLDLFLVSGSFHTTNNTVIPLLATPVDYTLDVSSSCLALSLPSPVSTPIPNYVDVPADESGRCTSVTGNGSVDLYACSTGTMSAAWQITEPSGDAAAFSGSGVVVGAVTVLATKPSGSFVDDGSTGDGALVGVLLPPVGALCGTFKTMDFTALVAGVY